MADSLKKQTQGDSMNIPPGIDLKVGLEEPGLMLIESKTPRPSRLWVEAGSALQAQKTLQTRSLIETAAGITLEVTDSWGNVVGLADYTKNPDLARN